MTTPDPNANPNPSDTTPTPTKQTNKAGGTAILIVFGLVVLCCVGVMIASMKGGDRAPNGYDAEIACEKFVKDRLKAPSTAKFSNVQHTGGGGRWTVTGAVDAQNSFGAMIRSNFTCSVRLDGDTWYLVSLTGLN